jgi:RNA polymerase sigma factor (sigma-70 family)
MWLLGIARHRALSYLRDMKRRRKREKDGLTDVLASWGIQHTQADEARLSAREHEFSALQTCLQQLPGKSMQLIREYYFKARKITDIARQIEQKEGTVRMTLMRIRRGLRDCIRKRLQPQET